MIIKCFLFRLEDDRECCSLRCGHCILMLIKFLDIVVQCYVSEFVGDTKCGNVVNSEEEN